MNKSSLHSFSKNFLHTFTANVISLLFNALLVFILPKYLDSVQYGYWQLYQMYALYIGYLTFGITDGVHLRYGGDEYDALPKPLFRSQFWFLVVAHLVSDAVIMLFVWQFVQDQNKVLIFAFMCAAGILYVPKTLITFTQLATNRIKDYSKITIFEKLIIMVIVLAMTFMGSFSFVQYIYADIIGRVLTILYSVYLAKDLAIGALPTRKLFFEETTQNMTVGMKVLIANLSSLLINGVVRLFIEQKWGIEVFGQISFSFSVSNIITTLILAISVVFYPALRRMTKERYTEVYQLVRSTLMIPLAGMLLFYFPIAAVLRMWIPSYTTSIRYLALLFPITLFESNVKLLVNNYLKSLRKEGFLMANNVLAVILTAILSYITAYLMNNLILTILVIVVIYILRCVIAEAYVNKVLGVNTNRDMIYDVILAGAFTLAAWNLEIVSAAAVYGIIYFCYLLLKKQDVVAIIQIAKNRSSR